MLVAACSDAGPSAPEFASPPSTSTSSTSATTATTATTSTTISPPAPSSTIVDFGDTEGCTPDVWAGQSELWDDDGDVNIGDEPALRPGRSLEEAFSRFQRDIEPWTTAHPTVAHYRALTLLEALRLDVDGDGVDAAARTLLRTAAASYLNAGYETIQFPFRRFQTGENGNPSLSAQLTEALASGDETVMLDLAARLDGANRLGCPLG